MNYISRHALRCVAPLLSARDVFSTQPLALSIRSPPYYFHKIATKRPHIRYCFSTLQCRQPPTPSTKWPTAPPTKRLSRHALYRLIGVAIQLHRVTFLSLMDHAPSPLFRRSRVAGRSPTLAHVIRVRARRACVRPYKLSSGGMWSLPQLPPAVSAVCECVLRSLASAHISYS